jgi:hypothetical protein
MSHAESPSVLSPEEFTRTISLVRNRDKDEAGFQRLLEEQPGIREAFERLLRAYSSNVVQMDRGLRGVRDVRNYRRWPFSRMANGSPQGFYRTDSDELLTPDLAVALGDLGRIASMGPGEIATIDLAPEVALTETVRENLGEEASLKWQYPLVSVLNDAIALPKRRDRSEDEPRIPLTAVVAAVRDMQRVQEILKLGADRPVTRLNLKTYTLPRLAERLAGPQVLATSEFAKALELVHGPKERWHSGHARTKTPKGAFTHALVERLKDVGPPQHTICAAGVTGGTLRAAAAKSAHTPVDIYRTLALDNSIGVLMNVVASPHFNDWLAREMLKVDRAAQNVAVMLNGWGRVKADDWRNVPADQRKIMIELRVQACEQAIRHEGVNPLHVYDFLSSHGLAPDVPQKLWTDFIAEMKRRLDIVRSKGTEKEVAAFEKRIQSFSGRFVAEVLRTYHEEVRRIQSYDRAKENAPEWRPFRMSATQQQSYEGAQRFVQAWDMAMEDEETMNMVIEGLNDEQALIDILRFRVEQNKAVTDKLLLKVLNHESARVRQQAMAMITNINPDEVEAARLRLEGRKAQDMEKVRHAAMVKIKADYNEADLELDAVPRDLSRNGYSFLAADQFTVDELREIYMSAARKNPKDIPNAFQDAMLERGGAAARHTLRGQIPERYEKALDAADHGISVLPKDSGKVEQVDLFNAPKPIPSPISR